MRFFKLFALIGLCAAQAVPASAGELKVTIKGLRSDSGLVLVCLFSQQGSKVDEFPDCDKGQPLKNEKVAIKSGMAEVVYTGLADGAYALAMIHDEDMDDRLDTNFIGIPTEGIGVSNNPLLLGAPSFEQARFTLAGNARVNIEAKYFLD